VFVRLELENCCAVLSSSSLSGRQIAIEGFSTPPMEKVSMRFNRFTAPLKEKFPKVHRGQSFAFSSIKHRTLDMMNGESKRGRFRGGPGEAKWVNNN
jgi:hypothetical protein